MPGSFTPAPGTNYSVGDEPELARRLRRLARTLHLRLTGVSGWRSPAHSVEVGGFANDPHTRGQASDTPGVEGVPETTLERFGLTRPFAGAGEADHIQLFGKRTARQRGGFTLADYWTQAGGKSNLAPIMAAIALAESGGRTDAVGGPNDDGSYDYGLWQINSSHTQYDRARLLSDPVYNARAAVAIERSQGLRAWTTYASGAYQSFLNTSRSYQPSFGRTRPGGSDETPGGSDTIFASYQQEQASTENVSLLDYLWGRSPILPSVNDPFHIGNPLKDIKDFLNLVKWLADPRQWLRAVEFVTGFTFVVMGLHFSLQAYKGGETAPARAERRAVRTAVSVTPAGRVIRTARGAQAGRAAARTKAQRGEFNAARQRAQRGEGRRQKTRRNVRNMDRKYGKDAPF